MELVRGLHNLRPRHHGCAATIGTFDGVHLGHQAVLGQLAEKAAELHLPAAAVTFEPHPAEYFAPQVAPPRLTRLPEKVQALRRVALDWLLLLRFDHRLAEMPADAFVRRILVQGLGVRYLVVGDDFRFGRDRTGDFAMLKRIGAEQGFQVVNMHSFGVDGERVSSSRIREALGRGDLDEANKLLGRPYRISGRVIHGDGRGRDLGFPTANLDLHGYPSPVRGVFVVEVFGVDPEPWPAVASLGTRPSVGGTRQLLEVHLLDYDDKLYNRHLQVDFLARLRDEWHLPTLDTLREQIARDAAAARAFFRHRYGDGDV